MCAYFASSILDEVEFFIFGEQQINQQKLQIANDKHGGLGCPTVVVKEKVERMEVVHSMVAMPPGSAVMLDRTFHKDSSLSLCPL